MFGYLPAPFVYGAISDAMAPNGARWAMGALMYSPTISVATMLYGGYLIWKDNVLGYRPKDEK